jgi:hypothetical protein
MRRALHLGIQKALGVVGSHYQVDFEVVTSGYVVPVGVEDEVAMERTDALATATAETLAEDFVDFLFPDARDAGSPKPERPLGAEPFFVLVLESGPCGRVMNKYFFEILKHLNVSGASYFTCHAVLFFLCPGEFRLGKFIFTSSPLGRRRERRAISSRRRRLSLVRASFPLGRPCPA